MKTNKRADRGERKRRIWLTSAIQKKIPKNTSYRAFKKRPRKKHNL